VLDAVPASFADTAPLPVVPFSAREGLMLSDPCSLAISLLFRLSICNRVSELLLSVFYSVRKLGFYGLGEFAFF
jgi:hypothetical protein